MGQTTIKCDACEGKGEQAVENRKTGMREMKQCPSCSGNGRRECQRCNGTGSV